MNYICTCALTILHIISGVMHSHDSVYWSALTFGKKVLKLRDYKEVFVSYLPLSHIAANLGDLWGVFVAKGTTVFADKSALKGSLVQTLQEVKPTIFLAVPRVYEKMVEAIMTKNAELTGMKKKMFNTFTEAGVKHHLEGAKYITYTIGKHIFYNKLLAALGLDRCHTFFVGAAPITSQTKQYLLGLDIAVHVAYGMSEGVLITYEYNDPKPGSSGNPMPGSRVKTDGKDDQGDGEICFWGRQVMMGYLNNECKTNETIDEEGWLHTGDLGCLDDDNYLFITGA